MKQCFRTSFSGIWVAAILLLSVCIPSLRAFEQQSATPNTPPKELVEYVREARKTGQNEFQIQQNAVKSGWPETAVNEAIAFVRSTDKAAAEPSPKPADEKAIPSNPGKTQSVSDSGASANSSPAAPLGAGSPPVGGAAPSGKSAAEGPATNHTVVSRGVPDDYKIGAGDVLEINVWKEPDASVRSVVVRPDGKISMPLLKEVDVVGITPVQLEKLITDGLGKVMNSPDVTIVVTGINSKKIYVNGKVKKEGPIPYTYRMTVMQALSEAGGITDYAKKRAIYVLRNESGREFRFPFDYNAVLRGEKMELNIPLEPGDVIVVP
jgi:polysaccharide export outer membrane protein